MKSTTTSERLKQLMNERNLRQIDILNACRPYSDKFGTSIRKNDLSQYISGKVTPRQNKLHILSLALNVDEAWLMGYDVPKQINPCGKSNKNDTDASADDKSVSEMLCKFIRLDEKDRNIVIKFIDRLLNKKNITPMIY